MRIVIDTREQRPLNFKSYPCEVERGTVTTGDYSLRGLEQYVAVERKSLDDLVGCLMGDNRDRFERELHRGMALDHFSVVVEASMRDISEHLYRSKMHPHAVMQSVLAFQVRYGVPFIWAGSDKGAAYVTFWTLSKYLKEVEAKMKNVLKHIKEPQP